jgi:ABC-type Na+ efflux pump permease subunit
VASLRSDPLGQGRFRRGLFWGLVVMALLLVVPGVFWDFGGFLAIFTHGVMLSVPVLLLPGVAASLITSERELDRMDLLRSTLLTPFRLIWGKFVAALAGSSGVIVVAVAACSTSAFILEDRRLVSSVSVGIGNLASPLEYLLYLVATLVVVVVVAISSGLLASSLARRTTPALLLAYMLAVGYLWVGPGLLAAIVELADFEGGVPTGLSPFIEFFRLLQGSSSPEEWATAALLALAVAALEVVLAIAALRRRDFPASGSSAR